MQNALSESTMQCSHQTNEKSSTISLSSNNAEKTNLLMSPIIDQLITNKRKKPTESIQNKAENRNFVDNFMTHPQIEPFISQKLHSCIKWPNRYQLKIYCPICGIPFIVSRTPAKQKNVPFLIGRIPSITTGLFARHYSAIHKKIYQLFRFALYCIFMPH